MDFVAVIGAAVVAFAFGAIWYTLMGRRWAAAAGLTIGSNGRPDGGGFALPFIIGFVAMILVAGMMRHVFRMSGLDTVVEGVMGGAGIGAFLITPWVAMNYAFGQRSLSLWWIDSVNAVVGCTLMGIVLALW